MVGGGAAKDHKFVSRIVNQLRDGAQTIYAVTDKLGTPTYTPEFARCLIGPGGLRDCSGSTTWPAAARAAATTWPPASCRCWAATDVELVGVGSDYFAEEFFSVRPDSEIMRNMVLDLQGMNTMPDWPEAIAQLPPRRVRRADRPRRPRRLTPKDRHPPMTTLALPRPTDQARRPHRHPVGVRRHPHPGRPAVGAVRRHPGRHARSSSATTATAGSRRRPGRTSTTSTTPRRRRTPGGTTPRCRTRARPVATSATTSPGKRDST